MHRDAHGLEVTTTSAAAVTAFDHALMGYLHYRVDTRVGHGERDPGSRGWINCDSLPSVPQAKTWQSACDRTC